MTLVLFRSTNERNCNLQVKTPGKLNSLQLCVTKKGLRLGAVTLAFRYVTSRNISWKVSERK